MPFDDEDNNWLAEVCQEMNKSKDGTYSWKIKGNVVTYGNKSKLIDALVNEINEKFPTKVRRSSVTMKNKLRNLRDF